MQKHVYSNGEQHLYYKKGGKVERRGKEERGVAIQKSYPIHIISTID